jgi:hypothetical protein
VVRCVPFFFFIFPIALSHVVRSSDFSSDVSGSLIKFEQKAYQDNLAELRKSLMSA